MKMQKLKAFRESHILDLAKRIVEKNEICTNCLGRQFAHVSTGLTNNERGRIILQLLNEKEASNCFICGNLFKNMGNYANGAVKQLKKTGFSTFVVGSKIDSKRIEKEESLWEELSIENMETIKSEINRELGKLIEKRMRKKVDKKSPDVLVLLNLEANRIEITINPLYIYGKYKKLVRGIPQTKWEKYKVTVEDIIAKPFMKITKGSAHAFHGLGREDIDARCLDWRPFVFEIDKPKVRKIDFKKIAREVNRSKKVMITDLRMSDKREVVKIKEARPDKTYRALVQFEYPVKNIESIRKITGIIKQQTPSRVLHRRADKLRKRRVKSIKWRKKNDLYEFEIRGEAGLYIKELITGDNGRTKPSISEILGSKARVLELDVIRIHIKA